MVYDKNKFKSVSPSIVTFDAEDIATGLRYVDYFLIEEEDSGGVDYILTPNNDFSNSTFIQKVSATFDEDFDLSPFVIPRIINGIVRISIPEWASTDTNLTTTVELYRWDGSTETQLGSTVVVTKNIGTSSTMLYMTMEISNELIPAGEQLRVRVIFENTTGSTATMGIDPAGRSHPNLSITTTSKISVPFKS